MQSDEIGYQPFYHGEGHHFPSAMNAFERKKNQIFWHEQSAFVINFTELTCKKPVDQSFYLVHLSGLIIFPITCMCYSKYT